MVVIISSFKSSLVLKVEASILLISLSSQKKIAKSISTGFISKEKEFL